MKKAEAYNRLVEKGIRPSVQRLAILDYLIKHPTHPNIEDVYKALENKVPTLSRTTVYNTLRMLSEVNAALMATSSHTFTSTARTAVRSSTSSMSKHHG